MTAPDNRSISDGTAPKVFTIGPGASFLDALAEGVLARWGGDPLSLSRVTILLPTRRACRGLQDAFLRASQSRALLLPQLRPLGDLDADELLLSDEMDVGDSAIADLPPAMPPLQRQLMLARLILHWAAQDGRGGVGAASGVRHATSADQAVLLAGELARLVDQVDTEGLSFDGLKELVPEDYAAHWQLTLKFLEIVTEQWPAVQESLNAIGPAERRRRLAEIQSEQWAVTPPQDPVLVAGSTGSIPATADLMGVVARLPQGAVVLPGLDTSAPPEVWRAVLDDPTHPQHGLAILLNRLGLARSDVAAWSPSAEAVSPDLCQDFLAVAMYPAAKTELWQRDAADWDVDDLQAALRKLTRIDCESAAEEAGVAALILRRALDTPGLRAALVTPDRDLARRVAGELGRWDVAIDDSAGTPLSQTPPGVFLRLLAEALAEDLAPLPLLALLKHPLASGGRDPADFRRFVRLLDRSVLRGPRPAGGLSALEDVITAAGDEALLTWWRNLAALLKPFLILLQRGRHPLNDLLKSHIACAEALAACPEEDGTGRLWAGEAGEGLAAFVNEMLDAGDALPEVAGPGYPAVFSELLTGRVVRPRFGRHPRLAVLGPLEARLHHADVMILAGLNEGTWPVETDPGPWLSRPMRRDFGLPSPERRIGLAAQDFVQALGASRVYMTRATRVEGAPTVPSRWLLRLEALRQAIPGLPPFGGAKAAQWRAWAASLDTPDSVTPVSRPAPRPPVEARPRELSVTRIETWVRDPYALYAERILRLRVLDPLDADPGAAERGTLIHAILEEFLKQGAGTSAEEIEATLTAIAVRHFEPVKAKPGLWAFWWPRFLRIASWFAEEEAQRQREIAESRAEIKGTLTLKGPAGPFILTAKADRIDRLQGGGLAILDYKTGMPPKTNDVEQGFAPQLPLEAAIAAAGGFEKVPKDEVKQLEFWRLSGGSPAGERKPLKADAETLADAALEGLAELVAAYDDADTPYPALPRPQHTPRFSDYLHLARAMEWGAGREAESEEEFGA